MRKQIRQNLFSLVGFMLFLICVTVNLLPVKAATETNQVPITCYTIPTGNVNTYDLINGVYSYTGYITGSTDKCVIQQVRSDGYCKVKYPTSRGYRTAYTQSSNFFSNINFSKGTIQLGTSKTVYRRSNLSQSLGTVYSNDNVTVVGTSGNKTQIIYPISGGYKMGWVSGNYNANSQQDANIQDGYYRIESAVDFNFVLDVYGGYMDDGANIQIYRNLGLKNQIFLIRRQSDGYYTITAVHSGKALDVAGNGQVSGTNIMQYESHGGDNQKWKIVQTSDGRCSFISKCNGLYLDLEEGRTIGGYNIRCWSGNGSNAQKFRLQSTTVDGKYYEQPSQSGDTTNNENNYWDRIVGTILADVHSVYYTTGNMSARAGYTGQCTWYAYGRFYDRNNIALNYARHAKYWLTDNRNDQRVSVLYGANKIRSNCIAVRTSGTYGHTMYIEYVSYKSGNPEYVYYTECNKDGNGRFDPGVDCILKKKTYTDFVNQDRPAGYIVAR